MRKLHEGAIVTMLTRAKKAMVYKFGVNDFAGYSVE
jgi:hypothetical protein